MIKSVKVRLRPTKEEEIQLRKSAGVARFAYNWALAREKENRDSGGKFLNDQALRKEFTQLKQKEEYAWLYETSNNISKQSRTLTTLISVFSMVRLAFRNSKAKDAQLRSFITTISS